MVTHLLCGVHSFCDDTLVRKRKAQVCLLHVEKLHTHTEPITLRICVHDFLNGARNGRWLFHECRKGTCLSLKEHTLYLTLPFEKWWMCFQLRSHYSCDSTNIKVRLLREFHRLIDTSCVLLLTCEQCFMPRPSTFMGGGGYPAKLRPIHFVASGERTTVSILSTKKVGKVFYDCRGDVYEVSYFHIFACYAHESVYMAVHTLLTFEYTFFAWKW